MPKSETPKSPPSTPTLDAQRAFLFEAFVRLIDDLEPRAILDVGCGRGGLLAACRQRGIPARGVEADAGRQAACADLGLDVTLASASHLPLADGTADWVVLRHMLHHMSDPAPAVAEAWRVAKTGVVLAEPWTDDSIDSQRAMQRVDRLLREFDRARGRIHGPNLAPGELVHMLPADAALETRSFGRLTVLPSTELTALVQQARGETEASAAQVRAAAELTRLATSASITLPGSIVVIARK